MSVSGSSQDNRSGMSYVVCCAVIFMMINHQRNDNNFEKYKYGPILRNGRHDRRDKEDTEI